MTSERQKKNGFPLPEQITDHELLCVKLMIPNDPTYIADFVGHLYSLSKWWNWDKSYTDGDTRATRAAQYWGKLLDAFLQIDDCSGFSRICIDYKPDAVFVSYTPVDPFKDPTETPSGYLFPPWVVISPTDILGAFLGYQVGDVVTSVGRIPNIPAIITGNLPRILIDLPSGGDLTLDLLSIEFGGKADISVDGTVFRTVELRHDVDLDRSDRVVQLEINKLSDEPHKVEISFFPVITLDPPLILFGGGLRGFTFCSTFKNSPPHPVEEMEYIMSICEQLRWQDGKLQGLCCGEWTDISGFGGAAAAATSQPGIDTTPPKSGECKKYAVSLASNDRYLLPVSVNDGDIVTVTDVSGSWSDGSLFYWFPTGHGFVLGLDGGVTPAFSGDPLQTVNHMRLIAQYASTYVDAMNGAITIPDGTGAKQLYFQANDSNIDDNKGKIAFTVEICKAQSEAQLPANQTWCYTIDLTQAMPSYVTLLSGIYGEWVFGQGVTVADVGNYRTAVIEIAIDVAEVTKVEVFYDAVRSTWSNPTNTADHIVLNGSIVLLDCNTADVCWASGTNLNHNWAGDQTVITNIECAIYVFLGTGSHAGSGAIKQIMVTGKGTIPSQFGGSNC